MATLLHPPRAWSLSLAFRLAAVLVLMGPASDGQPSATVTLDISSYLGGVNNDWVRDVAFDSAGNFYLTGGAERPGIGYTTAILNPGTKESTSVQELDVFVAKFDRSGRHLWTTVVGGPNYDRAYAIEVDAQGYIYVAGRAGRGFPVTAGALQTTFMGGLGASFYGHQDGFVFKMAPDGRSLLWASYFGASDDGMIRDLAIDAAGNIYVSAQRSTGSSFPPEVQAVFNRGPYPTPAGGLDLVAAKISNDGSQLLWAMNLGGSSDEAGEGSIRVGPDGHPVVLTVTSSTNAPTTAGAYSRSLRGSTDFYLAKIRADGTGLVWATYLGGTNAEAVETHHLTIDAEGNPVIAAGTMSTDFPITSGAYDATYNGSGGSGTGAGTNYPGDIVAAKLSSDGSRLLASTYVGGRYGDQAEGVWLDRNGNVWMVGGTYSDNFPLTPDAFQTSRRGAADGFITQLSHSLDRLLFSSYYGGSSIEYLRCAAADPNGYVYFGGQTQSSDLPRQNAFQTNLGGKTDGVFGRLRISVPNAPPEVQSLTPSSGEGIRQSFTVVVSDANGASDLESVQVLIHGGLGSAGGCHVRYLHASAEVALRNDDDTAWLGPIPVGVAGRLNNSQCVVDAGASTVSASGASLSLTAALEFSPSFYGTKFVYVLAEDRQGLSTGWQQRGTWIPARNEPPSAVSVSPSSGAGLQQLFRFTVADPNGARDLRSARLLIHHTLSAAEACYLMYRPAEGAFWLRDDTNQSWLGPGQPGVAAVLSNSQCRLDLASSSVSQSGTQLVVSASLSFPVSFLGSKNLYVLGEDVNFTTSGWQRLGTWTPIVNQTPVAETVTPNSGEGITQVFEAVVSDLNTASDLRAVQVLLNGTLSSTRGCHVIYRVAEQSFWLRDDEGLAWLGPLRPQTSAAISNSQCTLDGSGSAATAASNRLTVAVSLRFTPSFYGRKNIYLLAEDRSFANSGWQLRGVWTPLSNQAPQTLSLTPASGEGLEQAFQFVVADPNGFQDLRAARLLVNSALTGAGGCYLLYRAGERSFWLRDDANQNWLGPATPGTGAVVANGQCRLELAGSAASGAGSELRVAVMLHFQGSFFGAKGVWVLAEDVNGTTSGWQRLGTWTPISNRPPAAESVTPASGEGMSQVFEAVFSDPNGSGDLRAGHLLVSDRLSGAGACYVRYQPATGLWLRTDAGDGWLGPAAPATGATLANRQCRVGPASAAVDGSGNRLTVSVGIQFEAEFAGTKRLYMLAEDSAGQNSGWASLGSWTVPTPPRTIHVPAGGNLQNALNDARPGDTITLEPGATYTGNFLLRRKTGTGIITITTADPGSLPPSGTRIRPVYASRLPKLVSPNRNPAVAAEAGARGYRLVGLEVGAAAGAAPRELVALGSAEASSLAEMPSELELDRLYIHGDPVAGAGRGVALHSGATLIRDCWISDVKSTTEVAEAIGGGNGVGPYTLLNNRLEAAGVALVLGGVPARSAGLVPADIVIRGNHFTRIPDWRTASWQVRHLLAIHNARRVLIEGNVFEYNWAGTDPEGFAVVFAVRTHEGAVSWATIEDVTFRHNLLRRSAAGLKLVARDAGGGAMRRLLVENNLFYEIEHGTWGGEGRIFELAGGPAEVTINHNTCIQAMSARRLLGFSGEPASGFVFTNNLAVHGLEGVIGPGQAPGTATLAAYAPGSLFEANVLVGGVAGAYPPGNHFPAELGAVGFVDAANRDYRLATSSPYAGAGIDGKDIGADVEAVLAATRDVAP